MSNLQIPPPILCTRYIAESHRLELGNIGLQGELSCHCANTRAQETNKIQAVREVDSLAEVTSKPMPKFLALMGYKILLPMVLHASAFEVQSSAKILLVMSMR